MEFSLTQALIFLLMVISFIPNCCSGWSEEYLILFIYILGQSEEVLILLLEVGIYDSGLLNLYFLHVCFASIYCFPGIIIVKPVHCTFRYGGDLCWVFCVTHLCLLFPKVLQMKNTLLYYPNPVCLEL